MSDKPIFVDTNILVYAYDLDAGAKRMIAKQLLRELWQAEKAVLSPQVLQEFYVTVTRKLSKPMARQDARDIVRTYQAWSLYSPTAADVIAASQLEENHQLSFWDALIVIAAQVSGTTQLLSEDMQDGQRFGRVTITNPFI